MDFLTKRLQQILWHIVAVFCLIEIWLWDHLKVWFRVLGKWLGLEPLEAWLIERIDRLSPQATLGVFVVPFLAVIPIKIIGLMMIAHGQVFTGILTFLSAKVFVLGFLGYLFDHCRDKLLLMPWFQRFYAWMLRVRAWTDKFLEPAYVRIHAAQRQVLAHAARTRHDARAALAQHPELERATLTVQDRLVRGFWFTLAVIFLFEAWLWDHVKEWLVALERKFGIERLEAWFADFVKPLSPPATLAVFVFPLLPVLPLKVIALALLANGNYLLGVAVVLFAKGLSLGLTSLMFGHCRDKLLQMAWFARLYALVLQVRAWATALVAPVREKAKAVLAPFLAEATKIIGAGRVQLAEKAATLRKLIQERKSA